MKSIILAITGASGAIYGIEALRQLAACEDVHINLVLSPWGADVMQQETGMDLDDLLTQFSPDVRERITIHGHKDMRATIASGSNPTGGMIITPCSMGTLCSIASGLSGNLIERAAAVCLKERRPLVLMARESPLSTIHLEQMAAVSRAGAVLFPPMPALYLKPQSIEQMVTQIIARALTHMGIENSDIQGWNYETY